MQVIVAVSILLTALKEFSQILRDEAESLYERQANKTSGIVGFLAHPGNAQVDSHIVRPRKIARGPRCTNFPPHAPNLSICPNDFSLNLSQDTVYLPIKRMNQKKIRTRYNQLESEANYFAEALLMPSPTIKGHVESLYEGLVNQWGFEKDIIPGKIWSLIARQYQVSPLPAKIRISKLGLLKKIHDAIGYRSVYLEP